MADCPYKINKEWVVSVGKHILIVSAIDADESIVDSIKGNVSIDGLDLPEHAHQHGDHLKEDIEKAIEEALIVRLKQSGKI